MAFIEVNQLKYRYPHTKQLALDGISFTVEKGQFVGIIGENKAGKSTLCQAFAGLVPTMFRGAYGGSIRIGELEAAKVPIAQLCRHVGLVFQNPFNQLSGAKETVFEEIAFGLQNLGIPKDEILKRVKENLKRFDMELHRNSNPFDLSGGQIQRVALASILAMKPEVLVLDEPTSQLDPMGSEEVFQMVEQLKSTGITVFMVEQKMEKMAEYCDRILLLHQGKQVDFDTPERIFSRMDLESFGVRPPVYTEVCKRISLYLEEGDKRNYPVTKAQTDAFRERFPKNLKGRSHKKKQEMKEGEDWFVIENLRFGYDLKKPVIPSLSLNLGAEPTAIIGQNGAGKTTLVKLLKGLLKPQEGKIFLKGEDISKKTVAQLSGKVGYVFQNPDDQIFKTRVLEEVMVGPLNLGFQKEEAKKKARAALEMTGLSHTEEENPYDLDLSERKMVSIASVLAMEPEVLILDEPTIGQDANGRKLLGNLIRNLSEQNVFVLAILHDMDFTAEYFERIIIMAHGTIMADGPKETVFYDKESLKKGRLEQPHTTELLEFLGYDGIFLIPRDMEEEGRE